MKRQQTQIMKISIYASIGIIAIFMGIFAYDFTPKQMEVEKLISPHTH